MSRSSTEVPYPLQGGCQSISASTTAARTSSGVGAQTRKVLITTDVGGHYVFGGSTVTATTADTYLPANSEHFVQIRSGQYVSFKAASGTGTVYVSEFAY